MQLHPPRSRAKSALLPQRAEAETYSSYRAQSTWLEGLFFYSEDAAGVVFGLIVSGLLMPAQRDAQHRFVFRRDAFGVISDSSVPRVIVPSRQGEVIEAMREA